MNDKSTTAPSRQSLAAVSIGESLLLYLQNDIGVIHEFCCDGSPAEVFRGRFHKTEDGPLRWAFFKYSITPGEALATFVAWIA